MGHASICGEADKRKFIRMLLFETPDVPTSN
jgi:hypothetical protein